MDLRTIMNSDASGAAKPQSAAPRQSPVRRMSSEPFHTPKLNESSTPGPSLSSGYFTRPPQPPPLQPPQLSPDGSSSYGSVQSPYQHNSASTVSAGPHSQHAQSPSQGYPQSVRDAHPVTPASPALYNQQTVSLASPYTPQSANSAAHQHQQQQQSYFTHQGTLPLQYVSASPSRPLYSSYPRDSPRATGVQQQIPSQQQFSPHAQRSQPGIPLGPPFGPPSGPFQRPSSSIRPPSAGHESHGQLSASWPNADIYGHELRNASSTSPASQSAAPPLPPPLRRDSRPGDGSQGQHTGETDRERSVSVSPKTIVSRQSLSQDRGSTPYRNSMDEERWKDSPLGVISGHSQSGSATSSSKHRSLTPQQLYSQPAQVAQTNSSPLAKHTPSRESTLGLSRSQPPTHSDSSVQAPKRKRMRYEEPPIYARKAARTSGKSPLILNRRPPIPKHSTSRFAQDRSESVQRTIPPSASLPLSTGPSINGGTPPNGRGPAVTVVEPTYGLLGPWEPSITGVIPHEEITKAICDFLFQHVVLRRDLAAGAAGAAATGSTAILEVEAKLGQLVDRDRGGRLRLPVLTECILNRDDSSVRSAFESHMSLAQHRAMNNFLNDSVKASLPQAGSKRIPLSYAHKKERDTFYEVSANDLPPVIQHHLHPRHKPRVRVTTDQITGEMTAKIVKCRIADLDIYSPRTNVDWRVSVNLEMNYDGDVRSLPISEGGGGRGRGGGERNKDRMSYRHLAYQVDLTQVAMADNPSKTDFEHELEIEISAAEVRRQGDLAMSGDSQNEYENLIKGFVDNIRVLARSVPSQ